MLCSHGSSMKRIFLDRQISLKKLCSRDTEDVGFQVHAPITKIARNYVFKTYLAIASDHTHCYRYAMPTACLCQLATMY